LSSQKLFDTLKDGAWHNLKNLADEIGAPIDKLIECARSLSDQGIIKYEENTQRIKIEPEWKILLPDETVIETT
jgi:predicted transcriptional regulator